MSNICISFRACVRVVDIYDTRTTLEEMFELFELFYIEINLND